MSEHRTLFSAHTQNRKLADREEIFSEFDKNCIGLESSTTSLNVFHFHAFTFIYLCISVCLFANEVGGPNLSLKLEWSMAS